ncbi:transposase [Cystobacter fuscus]|nr:transposase [Cystobacter fuscus]
MERRKRRSFNAEFKAEAVRLVREGGKSVPQVARRGCQRTRAKRSGTRRDEVKRETHREVSPPPPSRRRLEHGGVRLHGRCACAGGTQGPECRYRNRSVSHRRRRAEGAQSHFDELGTGKAFFLHGQLDALGDDQHHRPAPRTEDMSAAHLRRIYPQAGDVPVFAHPFWLSMPGLPK